MISSIFYDIIFAVKCYNVLKLCEHVLGFETTVKYEIIKWRASSATLQPLWLREKFTTASHRRPLSRFYARVKSLLLLYVYIKLESGRNMVGKKKKNAWCYIVFPLPNVLILAANVQFRRLLYCFTNRHCALIKI